MNNAVWHNEEWQRSSLRDIAMAISALHQVDYAHTRLFASNILVVINQGSYRPVFKLTGLDTAISLSRQAAFGTKSLPIGEYRASVYDLFIDLLMKARWFISRLKYSRHGCGTRFNATNWTFINSASWPF
jgi:hypothetical protein